MRRLDPTAITVFRQADSGEYLRDVCTTRDVVIPNQKLTTSTGRYFVLDGVYGVSYMLLSLLSASLSVYCYHSAYRYQIVCSHCPLFLISVVYAGAFTPTVTQH